MTGRCPSCRRTRATPADWQAFTATPACTDDACPWGGDRCWVDGDCGIPASEVAGLTARARMLRGTRAWITVPHPEPIGATR